MRIVRIVLLSALLLTGTPVAAQAGYGFTPVSCGDTITTDTTLTQDLVDCANNGIVIGADNITLDLNGYRVDGDGRSFAGCVQGEICDAGLLNFSHGGVTVTGGSVQEFSFGALVVAAGQNRVLNISAKNNRFVGIGVVSCRQSVVRDSSGIHNGGGDGDGMFLLDSHHVRVINNVFAKNGELGIHVGESSNNVVKGNVIARNPTASIVEGNRNSIRRNHIRDNEENAIFIGNNNVIVRNNVSGGVRGARSSGIAVEEGRGNLVAHNVVARVHGPGIVLGLDRPPIGGSHNVVRQNLVRGSHGDGFWVAAEDDRSVLKRNVAVDSRRDGFDVEGRGTKVVGNLALRNGDLGIEAARWVIDGGGNIARNNTDPRQCTNIVCSRR